MPIEKSQNWPSFAGWLGADVPALNKAIVFRAMADLGICEMPPGSNRSGRIDAYNTRAGSPLGSYWCASYSTAVYVDAGADVPSRDRASCDVVMAWAKENGTFKPKPVVGAFVLYGQPTDASHIGIIARVEPYLISIEGNAAFAGFDRNGEAVLLKRVEPARVLGYVHPRPRSAP